LCIIWSMGIPNVIYYGNIKEKLVNHEQNHRERCTLIMYQLRETLGASSRECEKAGNHTSSLHLSSLATTNKVTTREHKLAGDIDVVW